MNDEAPRTEEIHPQESVAPEGSTDHLPDATDVSNVGSVDAVTDSGEEVDAVPESPQNPSEVSTTDGASEVEEAIETEGNAAESAVAEIESEAVSSGQPTLEELEALVDDTEPDVAPSGPVELDVPDEEEIKLDWYILKVQSNRERSIADSLRRKIAIEGLDNYFGQVMVPTEKVTEFKGGKKKIVERKIWPGYIAVEMHVNDDTWFAIRETSGIGDFTGSGGKPSPMQPHEIAMILHTEEEEAEKEPELDIKFKVGDKVKVMEGNFENFEGELSAIDQTHGKVTVMLSIFGRPTPVELEYWQVETV